jgi:hypothetical protein
METTTGTLGVTRGAALYVGALIGPGLLLVPLAGVVSLAVLAGCGGSKPHHYPASIVQNFMNACTAQPNATRCANWFVL